MYAQMKSILAGCLVAASTLSAAAFEAVTVEPVEMRQGPSEEFEPIVELPEGTIVEVLNCDREWCEASVEDYDGFIPRDALNLGTYQPPVYLFPPLISRPSLWHGRYYSRDHFRYESRSRWRNREGRRIHVVPDRRQLRPLRPIRREGPRPEFRQKEKQRFDRKGPAEDQRRIQRGPDQPRIQRAPVGEQQRIQRAPDQPRIRQQQPQQPRIQQQAPVQRQAPPPPRAAPKGDGAKKKGETK